MKEKDINIEDEETVVENTEAAEAASDPSVSSDPSDSSVSSDPEAPEAEEKSPLEQAQDEIAELKDKYLRSVAEFDNYRKRTLKERAELVLTAILPVVDDMERAIENGAKTDDPQVLREGMEIIYHKLLKVIEAQGVTVIDTNDADFDTDIHEAVAMVPGMGDDKKGKVIDCLQKGYKLNDKVIRHAKVAVGQ